MNFLQALVLLVPVSFKPPAFVGQLNRLIFFYPMLHHRNLQYLQNKILIKEIGKDSGKLAKHIQQALLFWAFSAGHQRAVFFSCLNSFSHHQGIHHLHLIVGE